MVVDWISLGGLLLTALGAIFGVWKYVGAKMDKERDERIAEMKEERHARQVQIGGVLAKADEANKRLNDYQIEVAKTYATKQGVTEATDRLMDAIKDVGTNVRSLNDRLDRVIDRRGD